MRMPTTYIDEKGEKTNFENADFAIIGPKPAEEPIEICPTCRKKKPKSTFVEIGVCAECNEKVLKNRKVAHGKKRGVERTGHRAK